MTHEQPEPCLGRRGNRTDCDWSGRCHSVISCSVLGYCRARAVERPNMVVTSFMRAAWQIEAKQRKDGQNVSAGQR